MIKLYKVADDVVLTRSNGLKSSETIHSCSKSMYGKYHFGNVFHEYGGHVSWCLARLTPRIKHD